MKHGGGARLAALAAVLGAAGSAGVPAAEPDAGPQLWNACRAMARPALDGLAQRVSPRARWEDLVLPATQERLLREIGAAQDALRQRQRGAGHEHTRGTQDQQQQAAAERQA